MTLPRTLTRLTSPVAAALACAALALTVPATADASGPASSAASASRVAVSASDGDGDGLDDTVDGCPVVAAPTSTGCPTVGRRVGLTWSRQRTRLQAVVASPERACVARARISLWRVRPGSDQKVLGTIVGSGGRVRFRAARGASFYVQV